MFINLTNAFVYCLQMTPGRKKRN